tara:strand:- start:284 stop:436 length:153 start_codon:yes stop_codon:yes gene_type:complete
MNGMILLLVVIVVTVLLTRYVLAEVQRVTRSNKFMEDMENFDKKKKNERY